MFDNRWDNWSGDFAESFSASLLDPSVRGHVSEVLAQFGAAVRTLDPEWPDTVAPETFARVMTEAMPRQTLPDAARAHVPETIARFLDYLRESGRVAEGTEWAARIRVLGPSYQERLKPGGGFKGVTVRRPEEVSPLGRNDPCPCGSGKKYKKCCMGRG